MNNLCINVYTFKRDKVLLRDGENWSVLNIRYVDASDDRSHLAIEIRRLLYSPAALKQRSR